MAAIVPSLLISTPLPTGNHNLSWNFTLDQLEKIQVFRSVLFAVEYNWDMPIVDFPVELLASGLKSEQLSVLYKIKDGVLVNNIIFGSSTDFNEQSVKYLHESAQVVNKLAALLSL